MPITITIPSEDFQNINLELTEDEVRILYLSSKEHPKKLEQLNKELESAKTSRKYAEESRDEAKNELIQGHTLLTALGIPLKTNEEEVYYRKDLTITTRIALFLAGKKES